MSCKSRQSKSSPKVISVTNEEVEELKKSVENSSITPRQKEIILAILNIYCWLASLYHKKQLSIRKIKRLFGFQSEKSNPNEKPDKDGEGDKTDSGCQPPKGLSEPSSKAKSSEKKTGHGRNGKSDFPGAKRVYHNLQELSRGDICFQCRKGKLYPVPPGSYVHFEGSSPIQATVHEVEKLRCNACMAYFEASIGEGLKQRYHPSCDVSIALQKYSLGVPFYRLQNRMLLNHPFACY